MELEFGKADHGELLLALFFDCSVSKESRDGAAREFCVGDPPKQGWVGNWPNESSLVVLRPGQASWVYQFRALPPTRKSQQFAVQVLAAERELAELAVCPWSCRQRVFVCGTTTWAQGGLGGGLWLLRDLGVKLCGDGEGWSGP